jgi:3-oxoacyl-(acyl-carrier-protein) synthase
MIKLDNIVITGYGMKVPGAQDKESFHRVLEEGISTLSVLEGVGQNQSNIVAGVIEDEFIHLGERNYKRYPRSTRLAMAAANDAVQMAKLSYDPYKIAVIIGTSAGAILEIEQYSSVALDLKKYPLQGVSIVDTHTLSASVAEHIGIKGPTFTLTTGCTASIDAILMAKLLLQSGQVDACVVGGADAPLGQWSINGFTKTRAIASNVSIEQTGVPFSEDHYGFVISEGAGVLILEREESARKHGKTIFGRIQNVLSRNEGKPLLQSDETGQEMLLTYKETLGETIPCYVSSQALGLRVNDQIEGYIHRQAFQPSVPITSIKGMIGHSFAAMGAIQVISALISMEYGFIPPTLKTAGKGFEDLPIVYETSYQPVEVVSITSHGNSGNNACLVVTK